MAPQPDSSFDVTFGRSVAARLPAVTAGLAMAGAGLLHLVLAPAHAEHSVPHATALFLVGVIDIVWAATWASRQSARVLWSGLFLTLLTIGLYTISRFLPLPFEGHPEEVEPLGLTTQTLEALAFVSLATVLFVARGVGRWRALATCAGLAFASSWIVFGAASLAASVMGEGA